VGSNTDETLIHVKQKGRRYLVFHTFYRNESGFEKSNAIKFIVHLNECQKLKKFVWIAEKLPAF
jgi:hypothetical protein